MVFICKHLRPYPLNLCTFLRQVMPLSGKNKKNSVVMFGGKEPTPSPSQRDGSWNDSVEDCFWCFCFLKVSTSIGCVLMLASSWWKLAYSQRLGGSRQRHAVPNFQKEFFHVFVSYYKILCVFVSLCLNNNSRLQTLDSQRFRFRYRFR